MTDAELANKLRGLASVLAGGSSKQDHLRVRSSLEELATLVQSRPGTPSQERIRDACRILRRTSAGVSGSVPPIKMALRMLEILKVCRLSREQL